MQAPRSDARADAVRQPAAPGEPAAGEPEVSGPAVGEPAEPGEPDTGAAPDPAAARMPGLEPGWEVAPRVKYTASQTPDEVIVKASGENPTGGYQNKLVQSPLRIYPPQLVLVQKKPEGLATQAFAPFEVTRGFKAKDPIREVTVRDASGATRVPVEQARD
jgi:hypothetical protein